MMQEGEAAEGRDVDRVFVAFEGGGTKGLVHIGALRRLRNMERTSLVSQEPPQALSLQP